VLGLRPQPSVLRSSGSPLHAPQPLASMSRFAFAPPPPIHAAHLLALFALIAVSAASAQDDFLPTGPATNGAADENQRFRAVPGTPQGYEFAWWGRSGRTYIPERSTDLLTWESFPIIETGRDAAVSYGFFNESPRVFVRLRHVESVSGDPYLLDFDDDGLSNQQEFDARTEPFSADSDHDGMPDKWELDHGLDPRDPADALADANLNGVSNLDEYRNGNDPRLATYGGLKPTLQLASGNNQTPASGQFMSHPMRVRALRPNGTPWAGIPVHFHADPGEGLLAASTAPDAKLLPVLTVQTDADGYAQAWIKCP